MVLEASWGGVFTNGPFLKFTSHMQPFGTGALYEWSFPAVLPTFKSADAWVACWTLLGGLTSLAPRRAPKGGTLSHLSYWNLLHKILDVAA